MSSSFSQFFGGGGGGFAAGCVEGLWKKLVEKVLKFDARFAGEGS